MISFLTDEDSDDTKIHLFHLPGNRLPTQCYKKKFLLSFVLAIELVTVTIALHTIDYKKDHKYNCTSDEILHYLCPRLHGF